MLVIGLTGPTGAGKGVVSHIFEAHGIPVIDADRVYHELLIPPSECLSELTYTFGREILCEDGTLDRRALGAIVFSDETALARLNAIAHRHVMNVIRARLEGMRKRELRAVVLDAPQLFEAGADKDCNVIVSVLADREVRMERIMKRDGIDRDTACRRIAAQKSDDFFRTHSNYVIENNGSDRQILPAVQKILTEMGVTAQ